MNDEKEKSDRHRNLNSAAAVVGTGVAGAGAYAAYKGKKRIDKSMDGIARNLRSAVLHSPLNRSPEAKAVRKRTKLTKIAKSRKAWPKWRKVLNKLPGGRRHLFNNPILQRSAEKTRAKMVAMHYLESRNYDTDTHVVRYKGDKRLNELKAHRRAFRKNTSHFKNARAGAEGGKDILDAIKGERRNKRRKRFWEKKPFQDRAMAAGITVTGAGLAAFAATKRGRKMLGHELSAGGTEFEFDAVSQAILDEVKKKKNKNGWRTSRPTRSSVRIHHDKGRQNRRNKHWHERTANRNKMLAATALTGTAATGLGIYQLLRGKKLNAHNKILTRRLGRVKERSLARNKRVEELLHSAKNHPRPEGLPRTNTNALNETTYHTSKAFEPNRGGTNQKKNHE